MFSSSQNSPRHNLPGAFGQSVGQSMFRNSGFGNSFSASSSSPFSPSLEQTTPQHATRPLQPLPGSEPPSRPATLDARARAAERISKTLSSDENFPDLDSYLLQGISYRYSILNGPWAPFEVVRMYNIPDEVFLQYNAATINTSLGLFAEIDHAWIAIDNALFMWNYTQPKPELVGLEGQPSSINTVALARPRKGVFLDSVTHILILGMTGEVALVGLSCTESHGHKAVELFSTGMQTSTRGINVDVMAATASGRIFFAGSMDNDIYELKYQQSEGWFHAKCSKVNHTTKGFTAFVPSLALTNKTNEHTVQMFVDDSRNLLYALSSASTIRVFQIKEDGGLELAIEKRAHDTFVNLAHIIPPNSSLHPDSQIVSINPIPASEATRYHLVATTNSGYRIYLSVTSSTPWMTGMNSGFIPTTMQAVHVKVPPFDKWSDDPEARRQMATQAVKRLTGTRLARQFTPGYYVSVRRVDHAADELFLAVSDPARRFHIGERAQTQAPGESMMFHSLNSQVLDIGLCSGSLRPPFPAKGNELAVQFDAPATEIAILTNSGVHIIRRCRLVDLLVRLIRTSRGDALEDCVRQLIALYGRSEIMATALAVACGQGCEMTDDDRLARTSDPEILDAARKIFIEHGGKPTFNENADPAVQLKVDDVTPSARYFGIALYISRLLRSIWKITLINKVTTPQHGVTYEKSVDTGKLQAIQKELVALHDFFTTNKSFIEGLSGPEALSQVASKEEEILLQAEHRGLHALTSLVSDTVEGLSFVLLLFEEQLQEIINLLPDFSKIKFPKMTYMHLFSTAKGHIVAKDLVKAIVNRNIAKGSNVETIAEGLRRRCGSFCSAEDVIIFKAQELLKRAAEAGGDSEMGRTLLNDSLDLFKRVAGCLPMEYLESAIAQYISHNFYAGAIYLCLEVAAASDPTNRALAFIRDNAPETDIRKAALDKRQQCYSFIYKAIEDLDRLAADDPGIVDGTWTLIATRRAEAYDVITSCQDEVFLTCLYNWYLEHNMSDRLLEIKTPFVVTFLKRISKDNIERADLLWRYHIQLQQFHDAAAVQLDLARSNHDIDLSKRVEYLGQAAANAAVYSSEYSRAARQRLVQEIATLIDIANVQFDLLQRLERDPRVNPDKRDEILAGVNGEIMDLSTLFNMYADPGGYYDICLQIMYLANHRNISDIKAAWENLISHTHSEASKASSKHYPYESVAETIRVLASKLQLSTTMFPIPVLLPLLERYLIENQLNVGSPYWVVDLFLSLKVPHETIYAVLESIFYNDEVPFHGKNRRYIGRDLLYLIVSWYKSTMKIGGVAFGSETVANRILETLVLLQQCRLDDESVQLCGDLRENIAAALQ
ncbi:hypothetical protein KEM56_000024 [Ascosphaera pollenicola]|nr:hypothetical protein KEM56_000024 [Ascosphaera pollenicola]